jgi:hypothetical protein
VAQSTSPFGEIASNVSEFARSLQQLSFALVPLLDRKRGIQDLIDLSLC